MTTASMNAVVLRRSNGVVVVDSVRRPVPRPQAGEVLVRVHAVAVGTGAPPPGPGQTIPDASGEVLMAGPGATGWPRGARVLSYGNSASGLPSGYQEFLTAPVSSLQLIPPNVSHVAAAALGTPYAEAWTALFDDGNLEPDDRVVVVGAGELTGVAALQICRWQGMRVVAVSDGRNARRLTALGAGRVVSHSAGDLAGRIRKGLKDRGATLVLDVGGTAVQASLGSLEDGGRIVLTGGSEPQELDVRHLVEHRVRVIGSTQRADPAARMEILRLVAQGKLLPVIDSIHTFSKAPTALRRASTGPFGSVLLVPDGLYA